jgi:hypothetical protein
MLYFYRICPVCKGNRFIRGIRKIAKSDRFDMSVRPSACNYSAPTERVLMKFYI